MRAIAIDFETANEQRASPCAVGLAWIEDGQVVRREHRFIRPPEMRFSPGNIRVHGIRPHDVENAPEFPAVMAEFWPDLSSTLLLAHNAGFDMGVITATFALYGGSPSRLDYLCTRDIARRAWAGEPSYGLAAMARRVGVSFRHHDAEEDAYACARLALAVAADLRTEQIAVMADKLGLVPRRTGWSAAQRMARRSAPPPPDATIEAAPIRFAVRGSSGGEYAVTGEARRGRLRLSCTCQAGRFGSRCRHVTALLDGDVTDLLSDNFEDVETLRVVVEALGLDAILPPERTRRAA